MDDSWRNSYCWVLENCLEKTTILYKERNTSSTTKIQEKYQETDITV